MLSLCEYAVAEVKKEPINSMKKLECLVSAACNNFNKLCLFAAFVFCFQVATKQTANAETAANARLKFKAAVAETIAQTGACLPKRDHLLDGEVHLVAFLGNREPDAEVTVRIEQDRGPVHLFLYSTQNVLWALEIEDGSSVETVYTIASSPTAVKNLPDTTLAYSHGFNASNHPWKTCEPEQDVASEFSETLFRYALGPSRHLRFEEALKQYSGQKLASIVVVEPDEAAVAVSRNSIISTRRTKELGESSLRFIVPPHEYSSTAPMTVLPKGMTSSEVHDWLVAAGVAEPANDETLEYLCLRDRLSYFAAGIYVSSFELGCRARESWDAGKNLILKSSIDLDGNYICEDDQRVVILIPKTIEIKGRFVNCGVLYREL